MNIKQIDKKEAEAEFEVLLDSLIEVIKEEVDVYRELKSLIAEEFDILMKPQVDSIAGSNARKDACILKARLLEEDRSKLVAAIAGILGRKEREINFTLLSSYADESRAAQLKSQRNILSPLVQEISRANKKNIGLLDFSLSYVRSSMNFVSNLLSAGANYESTGQIKTGGMNGRVVNSKG